MGKIEPIHAQLFGNGVDNIILLIQELGNPYDWINRIKDGQINYGTSTRPHKFNFYFEPQQGVINPRCSLGILNDNSNSIISSYYPYDLRRPCLFTFINISGKIVLVATMHATTN